MRLPIFALAALIAVGACRQQAEPAPDYRPGEAGTVDHALCLLGFTAVPVREISTGHHLVRATINGRRGEFVLDTGANMTVIDTAHLSNFGLSPGSGSIGGAVSIGGGGQARRLSIDSFTVGGIPVRQGRVVTSDLGQLLTTLSRVSGVEVNGIVGQDVLNEHRAIIDVARPMLYMIEADQDPGPVPAERCTGSQSDSSS